MMALIVVVPQVKSNNTSVAKFASQILSGTTRTQIALRRPLMIESLAPDFDVQAMMRDFGD